MSMHVDDPLFLGLDLSTQGLKAVLIDEEGTLVHESSVNFDRDLPSYGTLNGAIRGPDPGEVTSPVRLWLDAYDLIMERMRAAGVDFGSIVAISGSGQVCTSFLQSFPLVLMNRKQHGSVYWSADGEKLLSTLDAAKPLTQLAPGAFAWQRAPIWQDS